MLDQTYPENALDLAKRIFQVHAVDTSGGVVLRKALRRSQVLPFFSRLPPCLIGMEACGTSHHWARELTKLGHEVRLMPPIYVKPYVKRGKDDAVDAEAICEAVTRPTMRFVSMKSADQQAALSLHRTRNLLVKQRPGRVRRQYSRRSGASPWSGAQDCREGNDAGCAGRGNARSRSSLRSSARHPRPSPGDRPLDPRLAKI
jgi:transposase